jgi:GIY-YIG catalytic domain
MSACVYILRCSDGSYYAGTTCSTVDDRIAHHQAGTFDGYTARRRPVELVFSEERAIDGIPGVSGAEGFADEYLRSQLETEAAIDSLIRWQVMQAETAGFLPGWAAFYASYRDSIKLGGCFVCTASNGSSHRVPPSGASVKRCPSRSSQLQPKPTARFHDRRPSTGARSAPDGSNFGTPVPSQSASLYLAEPSPNSSQPLCIRPGPSGRGQVMQSE